MHPTDTTIAYMIPGHPKEGIWYDMLFKLFQGSWAKGDLEEMLMHTQPLGTDVLIPLVVACFPFFSLIFSFESQVHQNSLALFTGFKLCKC